MNIGPMPFAFLAETGHSSTLTNLRPVASCCRYSGAGWNGYRQCLRYQRPRNPSRFLIVSAVNAPISRIRRPI